MKEDSSVYGVPFKSGRSSSAQGRPKLIRELGRAQYVYWKRGHIAANYYALHEEKRLVKTFALVKTVLCLI